MLTTTAETPWGYARRATVAAAAAAKAIHELCLDAGTDANWAAYGVACAALTAAEASEAAAYAAVTKSGTDNA